MTEHSQNCCHDCFAGHVVNVDVNHIKANRHFCNKIWQAFRFFHKNIDDSFRLADRLCEVLN